MMADTSRPGARITLNGKDVTDTWKSVLESVSVTDEAGVKSDTCEIVFDNREGLSAPPIGAELQVWIGYEPSPVYMGKYKIDSWTKTFPVKRLTVSAKAADLTSDFRAHKIRSHHQMTVKAIVQKIAGEHGLTAVVDAKLGAIQIDHIDQQTESDMSFLSRLARRVGATFKLADGKILFAAKGSSNAPSGKAKTAIVIAPADVTMISATCDKRGNFKSAVATYMDRPSGKRKTVTAGSGTPKHRDRRLYGSQAEARAAAEATLGNLTRGQVTLSIEAPGNPALYAEALVTPKGFDPDIDGRYLVKSVTHTYGGSGYTTSATAETEGAST